MNSTKKLNEKPSEKVIDEFSILLLYACTYDKRPDTPVIAKLIDSGAEVNSYDAGGLTPLNYACGSGNTYAVKLLIARGAAVDLPEDDKRNNNNTPLLMACSLSSGGTQNRITGKFVPFLPDYDTIPEILIKNGANVNAVEFNSKETPLIAACMNNNVKWSKLLLDNGADVNAEDKNKNTPLSLACHYTNVSLMRLLLIDYKAIVGENIINPSQKGTTLGDVFGSGSLYNCRGIISKIKAEESNKIQAAMDAEEAAKAAKSAKKAEKKRAKKEAAEEAIVLDEANREENIRKRGEEYDRKWPYYWEGVTPHPNGLQPARENYINPPNVDGGRNQKRTKRNKRTKKVKKNKRTKKNKNGKRKSSRRTR